MSLETVLKNIYSYVELLQTVCTDKVVTWDRSNLKDALKWAKYCEQVKHKQRLELICTSELSNMYK